MMSSSRASTLPCSRNSSICDINGTSSVAEPLQSNVIADSQQVDCKDLRYTKPMESINIPDDLTHHVDCSIVSRGHQYKCGAIMLLKTTGLKAESMPNQAKISISRQRQCTMFQQPPTHHMSHNVLTCQQTLPAYMPQHTNTGESSTLQPLESYRTLPCKRWTVLPFDLGANTKQLMQVADVSLSVNRGTSTYVGSRALANRGDLLGLLPICDAGGMVLKRLSCFLEGGSFESVICIVSEDTFCIQSTLGIDRISGKPRYQGHSL